MITLGNIVTIDQKIAEWFNNNFSTTPLPDGQWSYGNLVLCLIAILLCTLLTGLIGMERERRRRSAGLRTHLLVGLGSCIVMIISIYGFPLSDSQRDAARLAAQVIAGIGFLGAGTIMHNRAGVSGLTTASSVWSTMAVGLACGSMNFILAIVATIIILFVLIYFRRAEEKISAVSPIFVIVAPADQPSLTNLNKIAEEEGWQLSRVTSRLIESSDNQGALEISFVVTANDKRKLDRNQVMTTIDSKMTLISILPVENM